MSGSRRKRLRQRLLAGIALVSLVVLGGIGTGCSGNNFRGIGDATSSASATATNPAAGAASSMDLAATVPDYREVSRTNSERFDHKPTCYLVIAPVSLTDDGFKSAVKLVIESVAQQLQSPDFSAKVYDDEAIATAEALLQPASSPAEIQLRAQHLVAYYTGGIDIDSAQVSTAPDAYTISWFPGASADTPEVGIYVGSVQWQPSLGQSSTQTPTSSPSVTSSPGQSLTPTPSATMLTPTETANSPTPDPETTESESQYYPKTVTAGAFCSSAYEGWYGWTSKGKLMRCSSTETDSRLRWRAA